MFGFKLWWRWHSFKRDAAKFRQRAVELNGREARRIARDRLLELAEGAAKERGVYRLITRELAKQVLRDAIADVREATRRREPSDGPFYLSAGRCRGRGRSSMSPRSRQRYEN
jgi:glutamyl-tRNA reductase